MREMREMRGWRKQQTYDWTGLVGKLGHIRANLIFFLPIASERRHHSSLLRFTLQFYFLDSSLRMPFTAGQFRLSFLFVTEADNEQVTPRRARACSRLGVRNVIPSLPENPTKWDPTYTGMSFIASLAAARERERKELIDGGVLFKGCSVDSLVKPPVSPTPLPTSTKACIGMKTPFSSIWRTPRR